MNKEFHRPAWGNVFIIALGTALLYGGSEIVSDVSAFAQNFHKAKRFMAGPLGYLLLILGGVIVAKGFYDLFHPQVAVRADGEGVNLYASSISDVQIPWRAITSISLDTRALPAFRSHLHGPTPTSEFEVIVFGLNEGTFQNPDFVALDQDTRLFCFANGSIAGDRGCPVDEVVFTTEFASSHAEVVEGLEACRIHDTRSPRPSP